MSTKSPSPAAVMGDLIAHREAQDARQVQRRFNDAVARANERYSRHILSPLTITLGDEFQGITRSLASAFEIAWFLRLELLAQETPCRFVVGDAALETDINPQNAWNMMGPGLTAVREKLNQRTDANAFGFVLFHAPVVEMLLDTLGLVLTDMQSEWTERQSAFALEWFGTAHPLASELALKFDVTERNVNKVLKAAKRDEITRIHASILEALKAGSVSV